MEQLLRRPVPPPVTNVPFTLTAGPCLDAPPAPFLNPVFSQAPCSAGHWGSPSTQNQHHNPIASLQQHQQKAVPGPGAHLLHLRGRLSSCGKAGEDADAGRMFCCRAVPVPGLPTFVSMFTFKWSSPPCPTSEGKNQQPLRAHKGGRSQDPTSEPVTVPHHSQAATFFLQVLPGLRYQRCSRRGCRGCRGRRTQLTRPSKQVLQVFRPEIFGTLSGSTLCPRCARCVTTQPQAALVMT